MNNIMIALLGGIMGMLGLDRYVVDIATFDYRETVGLIDELISNWKRVKGPLSERIENLVIQLRSKIKSVLLLS